MRAFSACHEPLCTALRRICATTGFPIASRWTASRWHLPGCVTPFRSSPAFRHLPRRYATNGGTPSAKDTGAGLFGLGAHVAADLVRLGRDAITHSEAVVSALLKVSSERRLSAKELVYVIDHISNTLCLVADPCELLRHVHPCDSWRSSANTAVEDVSGFISRINIDDKLYDLMNRVYEECAAGINEEESLVFRHMIESMRHQGVGLAASARAAYLDLQHQESQLSFELSDGGALRHVAVDSINGRAVPRNPALYTYLLRSCPDESVRRVVWAAQCESDPGCLGKLLDLRRIRGAIASTRDFRNFAECAQRECILSTPASVESFLAKCASSMRAELLSELHDLRELKRAITRSPAASLEPWDIDYLMASEKDQLAVHFSVGCVIGYFERLLFDLFGITLVRDPTESLWHPLVAKFIVFKSSVPPSHASGGGIPPPPPAAPFGPKGAGLPTSTPSECREEIAHLYMDLFARDDKAPVCAQFTVRCSKLLDRGPTSDSHECSSVIPSLGISGNAGLPRPVAVRSSDGSLRQPPATTIVCSFPLTGAFSDIESALKISRIDAAAAQTLFHELGHTVHALCSRTSLQHLSGNRGGVDFAEFSSHLFELYFVDGLPEMCRMEGLPPGSADRALQMFRKYSAVESARMALMALLDLRFYTSPSALEAADVTALRDSIRLFDAEFESTDVCRLLGLPAVSNFEHLIHYGGTYFCYLYARVLAIKIWRSFEGRSRDRCTGDRLYEFFSKGSTDASLAPLNVLAGRDLGSMEDELFFG